MGQVSRNAPLQELQERLEKLSSDIRRATETVVEKRAWASQVRRTSRREKQALFGWKDIVNKIPKRSTVPGKLAKLKKAAQQAMAECRDAVPVWIMPVNELVENFDLGTTRFDVVIIDEASQTDVSGLLLYYIADKVLVVGDHEQVSPAAVGQKDAVVQGLIDEHLTGIPNAILYDGRTSIYDRARQSSGEIICLLEHFRCLPEIIQFSNDLCYSGRIKPLRDTSSVSLNPTVVSYRVEGAQTGYQVNEPEAEAVASLIAACVESDAYDGKSFGVVSLVGDRQVLEIERILLESLDPERYAEHQIVCGNPAQFQGDERDVVFLSMVDVADDGPLRMRNQPLFRQRFNVAASRAKDQLWVVHSLDPKRDVKPGDLRRRLIEHALDPASVVRKLDRLGHQTESEFERRVLGHLVRAGYKVVPQWPVGYYRIDLVAVGGGKRLAIECDGDRYHTMDDLENDVARQLTLERLGWTFVRIRGSHFFRDPDGAMEPVFASLEALGITPEDTQVGEEHTVAPALLDAVGRRAAEIRAAWATGADWELPEPGLETSLDPVSELAGTAEVPPVEEESSETISEPRQRLDTSIESEVAHEESPAIPEELDDDVSKSDDEACSGGVQSTESGDLPTSDSEVWLGLSHWAKVETHFEGWERGILYSVGRYLRQGWSVTEKQATHASRLFGEAIRLGFEPSDHENSQQQLWSGSGKPDDDVAGAGTEQAADESPVSPRIQDVPQDEIREAIFANVPRAGQIAREELLRDARKALGFSKLGRNVKTRLNRCIGGLVRSGRLGTDSDSVWLGQESDSHDAGEN